VSYANHNNKLLLFPSHPAHCNIVALLINAEMYYRKTSNRGRVPNRSRVSNTSRVHLVVYQLTAY